MRRNKLKKREKRLRSVKVQRSTSYLQTNDQYSKNTYQLISFLRSRNVKLLSFGADADATEESEPVTFKKKAIVRPDRKLQRVFLLVLLMTSFFLVIDTPQPIPEILSRPTPSSRIKDTSTEVLNEPETKVI